MDDILIYIITGALAGLIAGLLGVGGGLVIVPVLTFIFFSKNYEHAVVVHLAIGSSLATIIFTSLSSMRAHHLHGAIHWQIVKQLFPWIMIGAVLGALLANLIDTTRLKLIFAIYELMVAVQILFKIAPKAQQLLPSKNAMWGIGTFIGSISSLVGVGGGATTVTFLVWCSVSMRESIATASACGLPIAIAGSISFLVIGMNNADLPSYSTGYIYWPAVLGISLSSILTAPFGAKLAHILPVRLLKQIFAFLLIVLATKMFLQ